MSENLIQRLAEAEKQNNESIGVTGQIIVYLGNGEYGTNARVSVASDISKREVWYRNSLNSNERSIAVLDPNCNIPYQNIETYRDYECYASKLPGDDTLYVTRLTGLGIRAAGDQSPMERMINVAAHPTQDRMVPLRGRPSDPLSKSVQIDGPFTYSFGGSLKFFTDGMYNATSDIAALSAGQHQIGVVYLNPATGLLGIVKSTAASAVGSLPARGEIRTSMIEALTLTSYYPSCVVYLYKDQAAIEEADMLRQYDPRLNYEAVESYLKRRTVADAAYAVVASDFLIAYTSLTASRTVTLPAAASSGGTSTQPRELVVKDEAGAAATHNIVIDGNGADTIDGAATVSIATNYGAKRIYCNGTAWFTM